jgi:hypothetical protein
MSQAIVMMVAVSGGFALLAVLAAAWWFATGQWRTRAEGARIVLDDGGALRGGPPAAGTPPAGASPHGTG